jgi:glycyl-tRNA synthetase beta chain
MTRKTASKKTATRSPARRAPAAGKTASATLLVELLTEELPPRSLARLGEAFAAGVDEGLRELGYLAPDSVKRVYATPRRLAVSITQVLARQPDRVVERKGPAVAAGLDAGGQPTPALVGFAKSCGVDVAKLQRRSGDKGEYFVYSARQSGEVLATHLAGVVGTSLKKLPVAKLMRWGDRDTQFVRPVHGLIMLHGKKVVAGEVLGLHSGNKTLGHRFLSKGTLSIDVADNYAKILEKKGWVIADLERRKDMIAERLDAAAKKIDAHASWALGNHAALLGEVASIVEYPVVYPGSFAEDFLRVPRECLVISMQQHQKYFPLAHCPPGDEAGRLLPRFLFVSNNRSKSSAQVIHGNERVLRARLSDAGFFYDQDRKTPLVERVPRLANVVYHNKLGSQLQRVERIQKLAVAIAPKLDRPDTEAVARAAWLSKADLLTDMVGEFPELQGTMGRYYAEHDGEPPAVAQAIWEHYLPRFAGDDLPTSLDSISLALADKLDTLVGIYGAGMVPTGDKDPFGLRRLTLGVVRILLEGGTIPSVDIVELLTLARGHYPPGVVADSVAQDLYGFVLDRLRPYLRDQAFLPDEIDAVLSLNPTRLDQVLRRLKALQEFRRLPEAAALAAANKRIHNILKQAGDLADAVVDDRLFTTPAEKTLNERLAVVAAKVQPLFSAGDYTTALRQLAQLREPVDAFFDQVMVMVDDMDLRRSRLALLSRIRSLFLQAADISRLQG